jgi:hypothetical protein
MRIRALTIALSLGAALAACNAPADKTADKAADSDGGDRRVEAVKGAESTASPNVDAAAAANQVQVPDYPPADADQAPARTSEKPPPPR